MKKVLIIEDDTNTAKALSLRMCNAGYTTEIAVDAVQGMSRTLSFEPDLVLLDVNMPGGNGISLAHQIRASLPSRVPIVFLTASKAPGLTEKAASVGSPVRLLEKPYHPQQLVTIARDCLKEG